MNVMPVLVAVRTAAPSPFQGALPEHLLGVSRGGLGSSARTALSARSRPGCSRLAGGHGELGVWLIPSTCLTERLSMPALF